MPEVWDRAYKFKDGLTLKVSTTFVDSGGLYGYFATYNKDGVNVLEVV